METRPSRCLHCDRELDDATQLGREKTGPRPGDFTKCMYCGHVMAFAHDLRLRALTDAEANKINNDPLVRIMEAARIKFMWRWYKDQQRK